MMKNNTTNYIFEYYQKIKNGSVTVGKWIDMVMEFLIEGLQDKKFFYDGRKADRAVKFIETFCHHCEQILKGF